jgi:glycosyltransferase involved in cell wall biosynthesis
MERATILRQERIETETAPLPKVLFVIDTLEFGGAEQSLLENTRNFKTILPVVCHIYCGEALKPKFIANGIPIYSFNIKKKYGFVKAYSYSFNIKKKYGFVKAYRQLDALVQAERPSLLVAYLTRSELLTRMVGRRYNIPVVGTFVTDLYTATYNQHLPWTSKKVIQFFKLLNRFTSRYCAGFVANSNAIKESNSAFLGIPSSKITVINRGRNSAAISRKTHSPGQGSSLRFLNVARLFPVKNHKDLLMGFRAFVEKNPDASLHIIGDGPLSDDLAQLIKNLGLDGKAFLLGARNDVPQLLAEYDCFVFPTLVEGFSGAIIEAMFAGLPVLASDIPQNKEALTHLKTGYLFKSGSAIEIEKALAWFRDNRATANELAQNAFTHAKENFELNKVVEKFESYLLSLLTSRS